MEFATAERGLHPWDYRNNRECIRLRPADARQTPGRRRTYGATGYE